MTSEGSGVRTCGLACEYGECRITARVCMEPENAPCGRYSCGRTGACDAGTGRRACIEDDDPCEPGTPRACQTSEGTGVQMCRSDCSLSPCEITARECTEPAGIPCGQYSCGRTGDCNPATGQRVCNEERDACEPGTTVECEAGSSSGTRTCGPDCRYSECRVTAMECTQERNVPCGMWGCGRTGECDTTTGRRACDVPTEICEPGTGVPCEAGGGTGTRTCGSDCRYSEQCQITERMCTVPEGAPCGAYNCGRTGACDTNTGERACIEPRNPCEPRATEDCQISYDGGTLEGVRVCTNVCEWSACEAIELD
jgi:hypothetical protein